MKISSLNVRGVGRDPKFVTLKRLFDLNSLDIVLF